MLCKKRNIHAEQSHEFLQSPHAVNLSLADHNHGSPLQPQRRNPDDNQTHFVRIASKDVPP